MRALTERLMDLMLESLGLTLEDVKWFKPETGRDKAQDMLQLNSYPVCPDPDRPMGLAPHTDSPLITLLFRSTYTGLRVFREGIGWIPVEPVPGALVVNLDALMHTLSDGLLKSITHRAVPGKTRDWISVGYFYGPPNDAQVSPFIGLTDHDRPPFYSPINWKANRNTFKKAMHFHNALERTRNGAPAAE